MSLRRSSRGVWQPLQVSAKPVSSAFSTRTLGPYQLPGGTADSSSILSAESREKPQSTYNPPIVFKMDQAIVATPVRWDFAFCHPEARSRGSNGHGTAAVVLCCVGVKRPEVANNDVTGFLWALIPCIRPTKYGNLFPAPLIVNPESEFVELASNPVTSAVGS